MKAFIGVLCVVLAFGIASSTHAEVIGYWSFDEGETDTVVDNSGSGYEGLVNGEIEWVNGKIGKAVEMKGADTYIEIADSESLEFEEFAVAMWVKLLKSASAIGSSCVLIEKGGPAGANITFVFFLGVFVTDNTVYCITADGAAWSELFTTVTVEADDEWHFIACTYDADKITVRIDDNVDEADQTVVPQKRDDKTIVIGANPGGQWSPTKEAIFDEVVLFNHALSEKEITSIRANGPRAFLSVDASGKLATKWGMIKQN